MNSINRFNNFWSNNSRAVLSFFAVFKINYLVGPEKNSNFVM